MRIGGVKKLFTPLAIFAVAILASALGLLSVPVAFTAAAGAMVLANIIPLRELYENVDWPIVVLLGATIPLGGALERSGAAHTLAEWALVVSSDAPAAVAMTILLVVTISLSNIVNNAAAAVLMAPIGLNMAESLGVAPDPFLMAVAVGAALPFITPIGHQSNILVMGPGGYAFGDYWKLGLPLTMVLTAATVPLILWFWPLYG